MESIAVDRRREKEKRNLMGIYRISHPASGRFYIGSTVSYVARVRGHRCLLGKGKHHSSKLQRAWNKYGADAFCFEFVEEIRNLEQMIAREQELLDTLRPAFNTALDAVKPNMGRGQSKTFRKAMRQSGMRRRRDFCVHGHALSGENLYVSPKGRRGCRACTNANSHRHRAIAADREGRTLVPHTRDRTHCPQGHPYEGDNLKINKQGQRACRECRRIAARERGRRLYAEGVAARKAAGTYKPAGWNLRELNAARACKRAASSPEEQP